jgi:colanic acid/amylovoran biosynthesis glycosyltransferase
MTTLRVLHSVDTYLDLSTNWIYPQIVDVPDVESRVICGSVTNLRAFPIGRRELIVYSPPWNSTFGIPRLLNALGRRVGLGGVVSRLKMCLWRPQIIHAHFGNCGVSCLPLGRLLKARLVTSFYGYDAWRLPQTEPVWLERYQQLFSTGNAFLVEGRAMRHRLIHLGCPAEKVRVHRIGVDIAAFPFIPKLISGPLQIIMVGRFVEKKGFADGLRACLLARSRGVDLRITVIGDASKGDNAGCQIKRELVKLASEPELSGRVDFTGFLPMDRTRETIRVHQIFLCPSKHASDGDAEGGSPVVLAEAMATGLLCIGTNHCDIPEVIVDGKTGYLCMEADTSKMAEVLCQLADKSTGAIALVEQGRKHIEEHFSLQTQLQKLGQIYASLASDQPDLNAI